MNDTEKIKKLMSEGCTDYLFEAKKLVRSVEGKTYRISTMMQLFVKDGEVKFVREV